MLNLIIVHLFGLMTPGPDFFYVSRMAASNSRRNTVCGILGITLGIAFGECFLCWDWRCCSLPFQHYMALLCC